MADWAKLYSPIRSTFEHWLSNMQSGVVLEKSWPLAIDQCWLEVLQFSVHLIDLLSIHLRLMVLLGFRKL